MSRRNKFRNTQNGQFWKTAWNNNATYNVYYNRLVDLAVTCIEYDNLPDTIDPRFLELVLLSDGMAVVFKDEEIDNLLALRTMVNGRLNVYDIPIRREAYASNNYRMQLDITNSVLIYNNYLHLPSNLELAMYAQKLANLDQTIDINVNAQKTPLLVTSTENERLSMKNVYMQYEGNMPVIFGSKQLNPDAIKVLKTDAPFVADKLFELKSNIWNEALTYLGIANISLNKKERLISDEVLRSQGGTIASRNSRLKARSEAMEEVNKMFGTNIEVHFNEDLDITLPDGGENVDISSNSNQKSERGESDE